MKKTKRKLFGEILYERGSWQYTQNNFQAVILTTRNIYYDPWRLQTFLKTIRAGSVQRAFSKTPTWTHKQGMGVNPNEI